MTNEERAVWIGERLGLITKQRERYWGTAYELHDIAKEYTPIELNDWLSSPDGIAAVKMKMIERGYDYLITSVRGFGFCCDFIPIISDGIFKGLGTTEAEAVLEATYKALRSEQS